MYLKHIPYINSKGFARNIHIHISSHNSCVFHQRIKILFFYFISLIRKCFIKISVKKLLSISTIVSPIGLIYYEYRNIHTIIVCHMLHKFYDIFSIATKIEKSNY